MATDPRVGYDTNIGALGPQTKQQWIAMMTASLSMRFLNGADMTEPEMADTWFAQHGFDVQALKNSFGALKSNPNGAVDPVVQAAMAAAATAMFSRQKVNLPDQPGSAISDTDAGRIADAARSAADNAAAAARDAANNQAAMDREKIQSEDRRHDTDTRASVDRESIAAQERTATLDRESRERVATADRIESGRQFDLQIAEDRRQFNASLVTDLFKIGVDLAKNPVDWIGYAYFNEKVGLPLTMLGIASSAAVFGAIPPTGPSGAGPVIGGPSVIDGDLTVANQVGATNPGFATVSQAVQTFPGAGQEFGVAEYTAPQTFTSLSQDMGPMGIDRLVAKGRTEELPAAVERNPVVDQAITDAKVLVAKAPVTPLAMGGNQSMPALGASQPGTRAPGSPPPGPGAFGGSAYGPGSGFSFRNDPQLNQPSLPTVPKVPTSPQPVMPGISVPMTPEVMPTAEPQAQVMPPVQPQTQVMPTATQAPAGSQPSNGASGTSTGGSSTGIYTGPTATPAPSTTGAPTTGAQAPQGNALLQAVATQTGIPYDQLTQVIDPSLLAGGYSAEAIANSPAIKAINEQRAMSYYRTDPAAGSKFGEIQAFGVPLGGQEYGFRGGQDLNAKAYLQSPTYGQQMIEGAVKATGQSWNDVLQQSLRTSPIANYDTGSFGRRRFGG